MVEMSDDDFWVIPVTPQDIKQDTTQDFYNVGLKLFKANAVYDAVLNNNKIVAHIDDVYGTNTVTLSDDIENNEIDAECSCVFGNSYIYCPHLVAALLHISKNIGDLKDEEQLRIDTVNYSRNAISQEKLLDFMSTQLLDNPSLYQTFLKKFNLDNVRIPRNYMRIADQLYAGTVDMVNGHANFTRIFDDAHDARLDSSYSEAASALDAISDTIICKMDAVDDPDRYYMDCAIEAIDSMADSILCEDLKPDQKQEYILSIFERAANPTYKEYWRHYFDALQTICTEKQDRTYWMGLVESEMEKNDSPSTAVQLLRMQVYLFENDGRVEDAVKVLQDNYKVDIDMGLQFVRLLRHIDVSEARSAAKAALTHYQNDIRLVEEALPLFEDISTDYGDLVQYLFMSTGEWKYFFALKDVADDWKGALAYMAKTLVDSAPEQAVDMYLKEKMYADALDTLKSINNPRFCSKYFSRFIKKFPVKYFEIYGGQVRHFAKARIGKEHYEKVRDHLEKLRTIPNTDAQFQTLLRDIRKDNAGRPLMIRTIANL